MTTRVNIQLFRKDVLRSANQLKGLAHGNVNRHVQSAKDAMIREFFDHEVTKEIAQGANADPDSGVVSGGNLFSYIGFYENEDPITEVVNVLEESVRVHNNALITQNGHILLFSFPVSVPSRQALEKKTQMHWVNRSWLFGIEEGIAGTNNYLFFYYPPPDVSRSTTAIQDKRDVSRVTFRPKEYMSRILGDFLIKIQ